MILAVVSNVCVTITRHRQMINKQIPAIFVCVWKGCSVGAVHFNLYLYSLIKIQTPWCL